MEVVASLTLLATDGEVDVEVNDIGVSLSGFSLGLSGTVGSLLAALGADALVAAEIEAAAEDALSTAIPESLEEGFSTLRFDTLVPAARTTIAMRAETSRIEVDDTSVTISMRSVCTSSAWRLERRPPGSLAYGYSTPTWGTSGVNTALAVSMDAANQLSFAKWGAGSFTWDADTDSLGLDLTAIAGVLPGLDTVTGEAIAVYPPFVAASRDGYDLVVSDVLVKLYNGPIVEDGEVYRFYVSSITHAEPRLSRGDFDYTFDRPLVYLQVERAPEGFNAAELRIVLESLMGAVNLNGSALFSSFPLPSVGPYELEPAVIGMTGGEGGYLWAGGNLRVP
jgi:hypothetical protein